MKTISTGLQTLLTTSEYLQRIELLTITLQQGAGVYRYTSLDQDLVYNGYTWLSGDQGVNPGFKRGTVSTELGTDTKSMELTLFCGPDTQIGGVLVPTFADYGGFDNAIIEIDCLPCPVPVTGLADIGTGDGRTTSFPLPSGLKALYKSDWQGNQLQYSTPRTTYAPYSQAMTVISGGWVLVNGATSTTGIIAPDGSTNAITISSLAGSYQGIIAAYDGAINGIWNEGIWMKGSGTVHFDVNCDGGSSPLLQVVLSPTWTFYSLSTGPESGGTHIQPRVLSYPGDTATSVSLAFPMLVNATYIGGFIPNTTSSPVTVTDYSLSGADVIFATAPVFGAEISGDFDGSLQTGNGTYNLWTGIVGDVTADRTEVQIEVSSLLRILQGAFPRNYTLPTCNNTLYDAACTMVKTNFQGLGTVASGTINTAQFNSNLTQATKYFDLGWIVWTSGQNNGLVRTVKTYNNAGGNFLLTVPLPYLPSVGDTFTAYAGCDKTQATCTNKFANVIHYRGFPYMPNPITLFAGSGTGPVSGAGGGGPQTNSGGGGVGTLFKQF